MLTSDILGIGAALLSVVVQAFNLLIKAAAAVAATLLGILPSFPAAPSPPSSGIMGFILWVVPLGPMLTAFAVMVAAWLTFVGIRLLMRWVKLL